MLGDDFAKDEADWQNFRKCAPPYLMMVFGPTQEYEAHGRNYVKHSDDGIETFDSFPEAKSDLKRQEATILPRLLSSLSSIFSSVDQPVRFPLIEQVAVGKARDGKTIHDARITESATAYVARRIGDEEIGQRLSDAVTLADRFNAKVARFYHLALYEDDPLKKFLYFFLAIEIETHAMFATIDHARALSNILTAPPRAAVSANLLFDKQRANWRALKDRFVWCVVCAWQGLSDSDVDEFSKIKAVRDSIAHGAISVPPDWAVASAERLAAKLQQAHR